MTAFDSCFYFGEVIHQRLSPRPHRLRYRVFQGLFDIDELPTLDRELRLFSHNRANLFAFHDSDHGDASRGNLRAYVEDVLEQGGMPARGGRIALLCMPRMFGYVFNPLSIYYCYAPGGGLIAVLYEVNNTFGQRHSYLIPAITSIDDEGYVYQTCQKQFYVSPFMDMDMDYKFKLSLPGEMLTSCISGNRTDGSPLIFTSFAGVRRELSDRTLRSALMTYPLLTPGVVVAIHWEAIKLFAKGLRLRRRPSPPPAAVTVVEPPAATGVRCCGLQP
jgi:hypothetical protein